jgi:hypothetical protein
MARDKRNTDKYRKHLKNIKVHSQARQKWRQEEEAREAQRIGEWRRQQEEIHRESRNQLQLIVNLLSFRIWQLDPQFYQEMAFNRRMDAFCSIFGGHWPFGDSGSLSQTLEYFSENEH